MFIEYILTIPILIKVVVSLVLILTLNWITKNLLVAISTVAIILGLWSGQSPIAVGRIAWTRFSSFDNLLLMGLISEIIWLSSLMAKTGVMKDMVLVLSQRISQRLSFAALPALMGLLTMPGGALFSAPMVDNVNPEGKVPNLLKTQTNYWFRHVWEYWWPLYPGVILALDVTGLELWQLISAQFPVSIFAIGAGYFFLLRRIQDARKPKSKVQYEKGSFLA